MRGAPSASTASSSSRRARHARLLLWMIGQERVGAGKCARSTTSTRAPYRASWAAVPAPASRPPTMIDRADALCSPLPESAPT